VERQRFWASGQAAGRDDRAGELMEMHRAIPQQSQSAPMQPGLERAAKRLAWRRVLLVLAAAALPAAIAVPARVSAQTAKSQTAVSSPSAAVPALTRPPAHKHKRPIAAHPAAPPVPEAQEPVTPPVPETPKWPAFEHPALASVVWDSRGLSIDAANSSLQQILRDISTATGVKVEGLGSDQRVFGTYGPGLARDVLSQLLQGSGYNVIMIGDQGQGTPREVRLSVRQSGSAPPAAGSNPPSDESEDADEQPAAPEPEVPVRPVFPPGAPPRSPQQIMQEMQQRQQEMQQRQQPIQPQSPQD